MDLKFSNTELLKDARSSFGEYMSLEDLSDADRSVLSQATPEKYDIDYTYVPFPSKFETKKELESMKGIMADAYLSMDFIRRADEDILSLFIMCCEELGIDIFYDLKRDLEQTMKDSSVAIMKLKYFYNRPRPYQVAKKMGVDFNPMDSVSAETPSYPSGHAVQSLLIASKLAKVFPHCMKRFFKLANDIAWSRVQAGYHFPSDVHYGETVFYNMNGDMPNGIKLLSHLNFPNSRTIIANGNDNEEPKMKKKKATDISSPEKLMPEYRCSHVETVGDRSTYRLQGRFPVSLPIQTLSSFSEDGESSGGSKFFSIEGVASSTSVDTYGTEMSLDALKGMEAQIKTGIPILPRHNSQFASGIGEWDEVIGRTIGSSIISASNPANPANRSEKQYVLSVRSVLYNSEPKTRQLMERLRRAEPIGQSVGGWFEDVDVIENRGEVERVIIKEVILDHIAITRAPANPDSNSLHQLSIFRDAISEFKSTNSKKSVLDTILERRALPFKPLPKAPDDTPWAWNTKAQDDVLDGDNWDRYRRAHLYQDMDTNPDTKAAYKLPIAKMIDGELKVVLRGVQAAMAALNGARGGVDVPESDKKRIYSVISKYYKLFDKDVPPLRSGDRSMETEENLERISMEEKERMLEEKERMLEEKERMLEEKERMLEESNRSDDVAEEERAEETETVEERTEEISAEEPDEERSAECTVSSDDSSDVSKESDNEVDKTELSVQNTVINSDNSANLSNGDNMTENDIGKIAALITDAVKPIAERMDALENKSTVQPTEEATIERTDSKEVAELKARLLESENKLTRMIQRPLRSGIHTMQTRRGLGGQSYLERSIMDAKANGSTNLASVAERAKDILNSEKFPKDVNVVEMLAQGLRAAEMDGLLNSSIPSNDWK